MGIASNQPVEYAIRNALVDLSSMPGFEVVESGSMRISSSPLLMRTKYTPCPKP